MSIRSTLKHPSYFFFFFFNDTATTEIYTLSLHDALPISGDQPHWRTDDRMANAECFRQSRSHGRSSRVRASHGDRKSTRLNSSHSQISYAVFCLKKKKKKSPNATYQSPQNTRPNAYTA